jgi:serine phosphatase RsbU (regulator of sigma subunit)
MIEEFKNSQILKARYKLEQSEGLNKINRIFAWPLIGLLSYLTFFSDPASFPDMYMVMLPGRLTAIAIAVVVGVVSFLPFVRRFGVHISFFVFFGASFMMAWLTGVMDNHPSSIVAWAYVSVIFCGIYPLPVLLSAIVVLATNVVYVLAFFGSGYSSGVDFQQVLVNINSASLTTLILKIGIERVRKREFFFRTGLQKANGEIATLNNQLQDENLRLSHELQVAQHIQSVVLPTREEYTDFPDLDIACQMMPVAEVGGDYYDTIRIDEGGIISMGDVTDHGLHSGLIMMMVHTALRALSSIENENIRQIYSVINKILYDFRIKTEDHRIMSLIIIRYLGSGQFVMTGQHESLFIFRHDGTIEDISSMEYGMYAGLDDQVDKYLDVLAFTLEKEDVLVLYTDGVTEAVNEKDEFFAGKGIVHAVRPVFGSTAEVIKDAIVDGCVQHIGNQQVFDDISVMVLRKR